MAETHFYKSGDVMGEIMRMPLDILAKTSANAIRDNHAFATWHSGLNAGEIDAEGIVIELQIEEQQSKIHVLADITARKKGDEALRLLLESLKQIANASKKVVVHEGRTLNAASEALFKRHTEYKKRGENWFLEIAPIE